MLDDWEEALGAASAGDIRSLSSILAEFSTEPFVPLPASMTELLPDGFGVAGEPSEVTAALTPDGSTVLAYFGEPTPTVTIDPTVLDDSAGVSLAWISPETGEEAPVPSGEGDAGVEVGWPSDWVDALLAIRR